MSAIQPVIDFLKDLDWSTLGGGLFVAVYGLSILAKLTPWDWDNRATGWLLRWLPRLGADGSGWFPKDRK